MFARRGTGVNDVSPWMASSVLDVDEGARGLGGWSGIRALRDITKGRAPEEVNGGLFSLQA